MELSEQLAVLGLEEDEEEGEKRPEDGATLFLTELIAKLESTDLTKFLESVLFFLQRFIPFRGQYEILAQGFPPVEAPGSGYEVTVDDIPSREKCLLESRGGFDGSFIGFDLDPFK